MTHPPQILDAPPPPPPSQIGGLFHTSKFGVTGRTYTCSQYSIQYSEPAKRLGFGVRKLISYFLSTPHHQVSSESISREVGSTRDSYVKIVINQYPSRRFCHRVLIISLLEGAYPSARTRKACSFHLLVTLSHFSGVVRMISAEARLRSDRPLAEGPEVESLVSSARRSPSGPNLALQSSRVCWHRAWIFRAGVRPSNLSSLSVWAYVDPT